MRQKKGDALADKKGGATGPSGSFAKSDVPQHPAQGSGKNLEMVSKPHLRPNGCVVARIAMLTYCVYAPLPMHATPCP